VAIAASSQPVILLVPRKRRGAALLRDRLAVVGLMLLGLILAAALWPAHRLPHDPTWSDLEQRLRPPAFLAG
jgi:hypothetical protein